MKLIGKGLFSKVYQLNEKQVLIKSTCYVKECLANSIGNSCFPKYETIGYNEYLCKYYPRVKSLKDSLNPTHYKIYLELRNLSIGYINNPYDFYSKWREQFETISNKKFRDALIDVIDELSNYGAQISFEISPRNVAVYKGKLILLDVFFMYDQAEKVRKTTSKRRPLYM